MNYFLIIALAFAGIIISNRSKDGHVIEQDSDIM